MLRKTVEAVFRKIEFLKRYEFFENFGAFFSDFSTLFFFCPSFCGMWQNSHSSGVSGGEESFGIIRIGDFADFGG